MERRVKFAVQTELARLKEQTRALREEREHFKHLLETEERERRMAGYEIHDGLAQLLAAAMANLADFERCLPEDEKKAWRSFNNGVSLVAQSLREARRLIHGLGPAELEEHGIVAAIEDLVFDANDRSGEQVEFVHDVRFARLPPPIEHTVFRIVQEGLANASRYSNSDRIRITLSQSDRCLHVLIEDWGIGFDPTRIAEGRFGLQGIQERAEVFGGKATIQSKPSCGTTISVTLPIEEDYPAPVS